MQAQSKQELLCDQLIVAQALGEFMRHVHQIDTNLFRVAGVWRQHLAMPDRPGIRDTGFYRLGIETLCRQPDATPGVTESFTEHPDGQFL